MPSAPEIQQDAPPDAPAAAPARCLNCGRALRGAYCHGCGQAADTARLSFGRLFSRFAAGVLDLESATLHTAKALFTWPGQFAREYVEGRREGYLSPLRYFFLMVVLNLIISAVLEATGLDPTEHSRSGGFWDQNFVAVQLSLVFGLLAFPVALGHRWLYRRNGFNLAEQYAFLLYIFAQSIVITIMMTLASAFVFGLFGIELTLFDGAASIASWFTLLIFYLVWAGQGFFQEAVWKVALKAIAACFFAAACFAGTAIAYALLEIWLA